MGFEVVKSQAVGERERPVNGVGDVVVVRHTRCDGVADNGRS